MYARGPCRYYETLINAHDIFLESKSDSIPKRQSYKRTPVRIPCNVACLNVRKTSLAPLPFAFTSSFRADQAKKQKPLRDQVAPETADAVREDLRNKKRNEAEWDLDWKQSFHV